VVRIGVIQLVLNVGDGVASDTREVRLAIATAHVPECVTVPDLAHFTAALGNGTSSGVAKLCAGDRCGGCTVEVEPAHFRIAVCFGLDGVPRHVVVVVGLDRLSVGPHSSVINGVAVLAAALEVIDVTNTLALALSADAVATVLGVGIGTAVGVRSSVKIEGVVGSFYSLGFVVVGYDN